MLGLLLLPSRAAARCSGRGSTLKWGYVALKVPRPKIGSLTNKDRHILLKMDEANRGVYFDEVRNLTIQ